MLRAVDLPPSCITPEREPPRSSCGQRAAPADASPAPDADGGTAKLDHHDVEMGPVAGLASKKGGEGSTLTFKPLCLTFKDMRYSVPIPPVRRPPHLGAPFFPPL
jgi:hypothetical protein